MDEKDLQSLGFSTLAELKLEVNDFADLFIKTPGHIHNFKHVHWIDFITCGESNEESKVIINVNNKNYKCTLQINSAYLVDNPSSKAYLVNLVNLRELTSKESEEISGDILQRELPQVSDTTPTQIVNTSEPQSEEFESPLEIDEAPTYIPNSEATSFDVEEEIEDIQADDLALDIEMDDDLDLETPLDLPLEEEPLQEEEELILPEAHKEEEKPAQNTETNFDNGYVYDPTIASNELGLPLDLIEEFIGDFIAQAKEFKEDLYISLDQNDLDKLKILSHKLKGVAANLRIEDALEVLTTINTSANISVIKENLDTFYHIIAKLSGENIVTEDESTPNIGNITEDTPKDTEEELTLALDEITEDETEDAEEELTLTIDETTEDEIEDVEEELTLTVDDITEDETEEEEEELTLALDEITEDETEDAEEELTLTVDETTEDETEDVEEELTLTVDDITEDEPEEEEESETETLIEYSKESVAEEIGIDIESFNELFEDYIKESSVLTESIANAVEKENYELCKEEAIRLKGMSNNMRVTAISKDVEMLINSSDSQEITTALKNINAAITQLSNQGV